MSGENPFDKLNEDCLLEIFVYFDLKDLSRIGNVCRTFYRIVHKTFRRVHKGRIELPVPSEYVVSPSTTATVLQQFGDEVINLKVSFPVNPDVDFDLDVYADLRLTILDEICNYTGNALERLCLENLQVFDFNSRTLNKIYAIFNQLKVLKISALDREATPCYLDFRSLCPLLRKLKLAGDFLLDDSFLPKIQNIAIYRNRLLDSDTNADMLPNFYTNNQRLKIIKLKVMDYKDALLDLSYANLNIIEKLFIQCYNLHCKNFGILLQMPNLVVLNLNGIFGLDNFEEGLQIISQLTKLKVLRLDMTPRFNPTINEESLNRVAINVVELELFQISRGKIAPNVILAFIERAKRLTVLNVFKSNLQFDYDLCLKIANKRYNAAITNAIQLNADYNTDDELHLQDVRIHNKLNYWDKMYFFYFLIKCVSIFLAISNQERG